MRGVDDPLINHSLSNIEIEILNFDENFYCDLNLDVQKTEFSEKSRQQLSDSDKNLP
jgi:hypothetical protein